MAALSYFGWVIVLALVLSCLLFMLSMWYRDKRDDGEPPSKFDNI